MANRNDPFTSFNFLVHISIDNPDNLGLANPLCDSEFSECDGLEISMEPKTLHEGGNNNQLIHLVGAVSYGNLTLKRGMSRNQDLWKWFYAALGHPGAAAPRRGVLAGAEIIMRDGEGKGRVRYRLYDCLPVKLKAAQLNAKDGILAVEEMQLAYGYFTIEAL